MTEEPYRILIIDDSPEDRAVYRRYITPGLAQDYRFWEAGSGEEGLRLCREAKPDCILLDYQLPDLDGLEFLDRFQAEIGEAHVAVIMLTGHGNEAVAVQAMKKGAYDYLIKGLDSDGLGQAVQSAIDKSILRRKIEEQRRELESLTSERVRLIAELEQQAAALTEANQRKDEFLAMLAHELRNPLAPISIGLEILRRDCGDGENMEETRAMMERQVHHLARLVDDLLDVSRITRGRIQICKERVDFASVVRRAIETCWPRLDERNHELTVSLPQEPVCLEADPVRLEQVIANLLNNAAKYTAPGGKISLRARRDDVGIHLSVRDNGIGIAPDMLPRVFDMFAQADQSLARTEGGLGIGLTLVQLLVQLHGGSVEATSDGLGKGTELVVRLPVVSGVPAAPLEPAGIPAAVAARPWRVLVVDDNKDAARGLARLLKSSGYDVRISHDGPGTIEAVETFHPQVVLLDIGMPGMDGYQVAERLRSRACTGLLVAITGYGQEEDRRRSMAAGFDHHLVKPVDVEVLHSLLGSLGTGDRSRLVN